jgi:carbon-monoxide dehydrogenase iron sulfur subunit
VKRIVADPAKCLACRTCELACALAHADTNDLAEAIFQQGANPRIYIESAGALAVPLQCRHCEDAPCVRVCPSGALWRADQAGPVLSDQEKCIGCAFCVQACPFGVIQFVPGGKVIIKCDLCTKRQVEGLAPACVAACPVAALRWEEVEGGARRARSAAAAADTEG